MKTALITTTINVPHVLSLYRTHDPYVRFFVATDEKTPPEAWAFLEQLYNTELVYGAAGSYACEQLIGWNTIARRNIALLEALKWGAELIVSIDDDNIPIEQSYFWSFVRVLASGYQHDGIKVGSGWFDPGSLQFPSDGIDPVCQRGFPQSQRLGRATFSAVTGVKIGVAQGMVLGDSDMPAVDRISRQYPAVHQVSELLRAGIVTDPRETWAPLNSQNIAFVRELAPCFLMVPSYDRFDDIYAGLVAQRVMREFAYFVHFGQPFVWQQRNPHDLLKDLAAEQWGAEHILDFTVWLNGFLGQTSVTGFMRVLFTNLPSWMPERGKLQELGLAWCSDCDEVMK
jgi:Reversibly glycosylated polypeptide